jgi:uncharacterized membrane protein YkvA (DUF1232 family)
MMERLRGWARAVKRDLRALWLGVRDPRVPVMAKLLAGLALAYALSPIDLIPDFIPVLGQADDLILVPLLVRAALRLVPTLCSPSCARAPPLKGRPDCHPAVRGRSGSS